MLVEDRGEAFTGSLRCTFTDAAAEGGAAPVLCGEGASGRARLAPRGRGPQGDKEIQPDPIVDPTLELDIGRRLFVPSLRVLTDAMQVVGDPTLRAKE